MAGRGHVLTASSAVHDGWRVGIEVGLRTRRPCPHRRMAQEEGGSLSEARARVGALHGITDLAQKLLFYDRWALDYDQVNRARSSPAPPSPHPASSPIYEAGIVSLASQGGL